MSFPVILDMMIKPRTVGIRLKSPSRQSNTKSSTIIPTGVANAPTMSGSWCARYVSVAPLDSLTIRRTLPLPRLFINPTGSAPIWRIALFRILPATRNAAACEHMSAAK